MPYTPLRAAVLGAGAAFATCFSAPGTFTPGALASAGDYRFEVVGARPAGPNKTEVTVRLVRLPANTPVPGAVIFQSRADMAPAGMPTMTGNVTPEAGGQPGTYRFQVETGMAGGWALTLAAKVQGEAETVRATVTFNAAR